ncbi:hypothetical protein CDD81_5464 [Ophiocordyceps australis]|uniref:Ribosomal RNA-processing protein 44 n=1 Tax=Ophiocordyceps australis TaxID=1399860 RepID=A0A2C5Y534_9HYPO|nr:hypothetical protein CDD81_5464 [Ophiocordyceps australis]
MTSLKRGLPAEPVAPNISSKVYVRSTRSGKVQKVVQEVYLRTDIPCSSRLCKQCLDNAPKNAAGQSLPFVLSERPAGTKRLPQGHYLVPDTNALLNGMDLFEQKDAFLDVIILQTVLEELRNRSLPLYNRLLGLIKSQEKRFHVFFNDFRLETHVRRERQETVNDRNDRAIRRAVEWYGQHLGRTKAKQVPAVVMLSDDGDNVGKAVGQGLHAYRMADYVGSLEDGEKLMDMVSGTHWGSELDKAAGMVYEEYYSMSKMMTGVKAGVMHQGVFNVSAYNYLEGSVKVGGFGKPVLILGREKMNRAVEGDVVVVEVLGREQWKQASSKIVEEETLTRNEDGSGGDGAMWDKEEEEEQEQEQGNKAAAKGTLQATGKVVGVVRRNWRQFVGHIDAGSAGRLSGQGRKAESVFVIAMDRRIPKTRVRTRQAAELVGKRLLVSMDGWRREWRHPEGHVVRSLGGMEEQGAETEALLLEWDVHYRPFAKTVLDCLPAEGHDWRVGSDEATWRGRQDLRHLAVCSIDPPGCQDIDDALHARALADGHWEVGVHIADVSHFVKPATAMDGEASLRGTTVYLVDKRIDMLPPLLGTDLCSLRPHLDRLAFSLVCHLDAQAKVVDVRFTKSVIRSRQAFSYQQAQLRIDDASQRDEVTQAMRALLMLSKKLRQRRLAAGALSLESPQVKVHLDSESADPVDVHSKQALDTNSLVEEFMLLANTTVAARIYQAFPHAAMLRRHAPPPSTSFDELATQLRVVKGLDLRTHSSKALADSLDACVDAAEPFFNSLVRIMATRCMLSAEYFCAGSHPYPAFAHYGLASHIYTHFTSPIRRYADLIVHRQLAAAIGYDAAPHASSCCRPRIEAVCKNINVRHRNAQMAGRASIAYYVGQALKGSVAHEDAFVIKIFSNGFVVLVPRFGIEGLIRLRDLAQPEPPSDFDPDTYTLTLTLDTPSRLCIRLFQKVTVKVRDEKDESTGKRRVKMELVTP